ncbi:MAG: helix-turn-helix transcriptional regulator [Comamonadaceae bacterium]|nr:helix-turn-helix transcriptional regulator [Comamonadaceae bacterium]
MAAAIALAGRNSPAAITTGDIAREVGVTQGALFKHFPSREAIWLAVMEWVTQHLLARLENAAKAPTETGCQPGTRRPRPRLRGAHQVRPGMPWRAASDLS